MREIVRTVAQCHARNVLIRDVKPENFLYLSQDDDAPLKAIDFGMAQYCKPHESLRDKAGECSQSLPSVVWMFPPHAHLSLFSMPAETAAGSQNDSVELVGVHGVQSL